MSNNRDLNLFTVFAVLLNIRIDFFYMFWPIWQRKFMITEWVFFFLWFKTIEIYCLTVLEVRIPKSVSLGPNQNVSRAVLLLVALEENLCFASSRVCLKAEFWKWDGQERPLLERTRNWSGQNSALSYPQVRRSLSHTGHIWLFPGHVLCPWPEAGDMLCGDRGMKGKIIPADQGGTEEDQIRLPSALLCSNTPLPPHICALVSKFLDHSPPGITSSTRLATIMTMTLTSILSPPVTNTHRATPLTSSSSLSLCCALAKPQCGWSQPLACSVPVPELPGDAEEKRSVSLKDFTVNLWSPFTSLSHPSFTKVTILPHTNSSTWALDPILFYILKDCAPTVPPTLLDVSCQHPNMLSSVLWKKIKPHNTFQILLPFLCSPSKQNILKVVTIITLYTSLFHSLSSIHSIQFPSTPLHPDCCCHYLSWPSCCRLQDGLCALVFLPHTALDTANLSSLPPFRHFQGTHTFQFLIPLSLYRWSFTYNGSTYNFSTIHGVKVVSSLRIE